MTNNKDIAILTAKSNELDALLKLFDFERIRDPKTGSRFYFSEMQSSRTGDKYTLVATCLADQGPTSASAGATRLIDRFQPSLVVLFGIAGGLRGDLKIGQTVFIERIIDYQTGALRTNEDGTERFQPAPKMPELLKKYKHDWNEYEIDSDKKRRIAEVFSRIGGKMPELDPTKTEDLVTEINPVLSTMASGNLLIRNEEMFRSLKNTFHRKTETAEMEAIGVAQACEDGDVPWIVLKAISDFGDEKKSDNFHEFACLAAAAVLGDFLGYGLHLDKKKSELISNLEEKRKRNRFFFERKQLLEQIDSALSKGNQAVLALTLRGLGGSGKTQLATEYAYRSRESYDTVWWLDCENHFIEDYISLGTSLGVSFGKEQDRNKIIAMVDEALKDKQYLIVFDNAIDWGQIQDYVPSGNAGKVLITTRNANFQNAIPIGGFTEEESIDFICERTGDDNRSVAKVLSGKLECFPLALDQATAYMLATGESVHGYLEIFDECARKLANETKLFAQSESKTVTEYSWTVQTVWKLSFETVEKTSPGAALLLNFLAFFAPDKVGISTLIEGAHSAPEALRKKLSSREEINPLIAALRQFSLIERIQDGLLMHRLVQAVTRDMLEDKRSKTLSEAFEFVDARFPTFQYRHSEPSQWQVAESLLTHVIAIGERCLEYKQELGGVGELWRRAAAYLSHRGRSHEEKNLLEQLDKTIKSVGAEDAPSFNVELAHAYGQIDPSRSAQLLLVELEQRMAQWKELEDGTEQHTKSALSVARVLNNLGEAYRGMYTQGESRLTKAKKCFADAIAIRERYEPFTTSSDIQVPLNNLGLVFTELGDYKSARPWVARALDLRVKPHDRIKGLGNLGAIDTKLGDWTSAEQSLDEALRLCNEQFGSEDNSTTAFILRVWSELQLEQGFLDKSEKSANQAREIYSRLNPETWTSQAFSLDVHICSLYHKSSQYEKTRPSYEGLLANLRKKYGEDHKVVAINELLYCNVLDKLGEKTLAKQVRYHAHKVHGTPKQAWRRTEQNLLFTSGIRKRFSK